MRRLVRRRRHGRQSRDIVATALGALCNLDHRGASGAEVNTGDGAGILIQVPDRFLRAVVDFALPPAGAYGVGLAFLPADATDAEKAMGQIDRIVAEEGLRVVGWRAVPVDDSMIGPTARSVMPSFWHVFVADPAGTTGIELDRKLFVVRKRCEHEIMNGLPGVPVVYFPSLSSRTLVYKGMLTTPQLAEFFLDLSDERFESALALVHSRFSTNTFPSWPLAHPYRYIAHNGEINTVQGNRNWMRAREALMETPLIPGLERAFPIITPGASDTATFDECLELLHLGGRSIWHAVLMMIPEAWENHATMPADKRAFYRYHASLMEPWDGPASIAFTDGTVIGAVLDRNGLRPSRYWVTDDNRVIMASEAGVVDVDPARVVQKGRLQPGRMFLVDTAQGRIVDDEEIKAALAAEHPYDEWLRAGPRAPRGPARARARRPQPRVGGPAPGDVRLHARRAEAARRADGEDRRGGARLDGHRHADRGAVRALALLFDYFQQLFAQVTNPPLDAIREELVTSLVVHDRRRGQPARRRRPSRAARSSCRSRSSTTTSSRSSSTSTTTATVRVRAHVISGLYRVAGGGAALREALDRVRAEASQAIAEGKRIIVLSDRDSDAGVGADPVAAARLGGAPPPHPREDAHARSGSSCRDGRRARGAPHGAARRVRRRRDQPVPRVRVDRRPHRAAPLRARRHDPHKAIKNYIKAAGKGVLKVMSKMGISTVASYRGAQVFEAIGLDHELVDEYFTGTVSRLGGIGLDEIAEEVARRHAVAYAPRPTELAHRDLDLGGEYQWRREGEYHLFNPETVFKLQHATRAKRYDVYKEYTQPRRRPVEAARDAARPLHASARACASRCRSTRSSRSARSSSASRPARCRTARSRRKRTRRSRSR